MLQCPICGKQGELNTFCTECDWFLIDTFDVFSLSPIHEDKLQELNSVFLKFQNHRKNEYARKVSQNSQAQQSEINKSIDKLERQNKAILNELNTIKDTLADLLNKENFSSPVSVKEPNEKVIKSEEETKPLKQEKTDVESKRKDDREKLISTLVSNFKQKATNDLLVGGSYFFGSYPQDLTGIKKAIEWIVLAKENNKALLISRYALECKPYNTRSEKTTWGKCSLRKWLNDNFINSAFTIAEQEKILKANVSADGNPDYPTNAGKDTADKIFLLSISDVKKYFKSNLETKCKATVYANSQGVRNFFYNGSWNCWWWLRSPGKSQYVASCVYSFGEIDKSGRTVDCNHFGIRPALWIDLNV